MKTLFITFVGGATLLHFSLTAPAQPVATTLAASSIGPTNATLNGSVNPNGAPATAWFQFGLTTNYGNLGGFIALPATNSAQTLPGFVVNGLLGPAGTNWTQTTAPVTNWYFVASSADGARLAAVVNGGGIYTSTNSGATWTLTSAPGTNWASIASSADGTKLAAAVSGGGIYTSADGGVTWTQTTAPSLGWIVIASSADASRLAAVVNGGGAYTSTNSGVTWAQSSLPTDNWYYIVSSADGSRLVAVAQDAGGIYTSTNGGGIWVSNAVHAQFWDRIASSADGTRLAATPYGGGIYLSTDSGSTWTLSSAPLRAWASIACSADGTRLTAGADGDNIFASADSGATWTAANAPIGFNWNSMTASADGTRLAATADGGGIYTSTGQVISLAPATTYHYRVAGSNFLGTSFGSDLTFTTSLAAPTATTLAASGITATNATLNATVNPNGAATSAYFKYGLTTSYGSYTATNPLPATNVTLSVANLISSLTPGTTYHFQLVASNSLGTTLGGDLTVTTPPLPPAVTTLAASNITTNKGTLNGTVNPNGAATTAYFRYGLTTNYGSYTATNTLAATNSTLSVTNLISSLAPGTAYHFQLVAANSQGASTGNDLTFTTSAGAPTPTTLPASGVTTTNATLNGSLLTGNLNTSAYFRYGLTTNYGSYSATNVFAAVATNVLLSASIAGTNLTPNTIYHCRLVASNSAGIALGADRSFTTRPLAPTVITLPATSITQSNATLNGSVNPNGAAVAAYYQYGLTTNYDNLGGFVTLPAGNLTSGLPGFVADASHGAAGATWTLTSAPATNWSAIASSADGTFLAAVAQSGGIYTSSDGGLTWTPASAPALTWLSIASSANGSFLAAVAQSGGIYTSSDGGFTWIQTSAPAQSWQSIASSADGSFLAAVAQGGGIYTSTNAGSGWTLTSLPAQNWTSIACSADGTRLAAAVWGGFIFTSMDGGATWTQANVPTNLWSSLASSADGMNLAVAADYPWTSTDGGANWTPASNAPQGNWSSIASSADGSRLTAGITNGDLYTSTNSGAAWAQGNAPNAVWRSIASSADGSRLAAVANGGIYVSTGSVSPLTPGATYHYRVLAVNAGGTGVGSDLTFIIPAAPTPTTLAATSVSSTNATLNGSVNPNTVATTAYFRYGLTTNYGSYSPTNTLPATNVTFSLSNLISNLTLATTYHFQLVARNSLGTNTGADLTFTTSPELPIVTTLAATSITRTNATLNGTVNPKGGATAAYFLFGLTTNYGSFTPTNTLPATNSTLSLSNSISNLPPDTAYHFKLVASNNVGISLGNDLTFTTLAGPPTATTLPASGITGTNATLNGSINPNGAISTAYFRYGLTTNYGSYSATNTLAATNSTLSASNSISGLTPGTTYHFLLVAGNSAGTNTGNDLTFTTASAPVVTTLPPTSVASGNATLNGAINPNEAISTAYFRYGLTTNYGSYSATNTLAATNTTVPVSISISGLTSVTTYHFRLVASNSIGTNAGADLAFTTGPAVPTATTLAATSITPSNATLNGTVNPNGPATTAYFQFGLTTNYDNLGGFTALPAANTAQTLPGLVVNVLLGPAGANWTNINAPNANWQSIASSADGTRLAAGGYDSGIYASINSGETWTLTSAPDTNYWISIASSADGTRLAAVVDGGGIYTSADGGVTWIQTTAPITNWQSIASSADGMRLAAVAFPGGAYTSTNSGATWALSSLQADDWANIVSSADGSRLAAVVNYGGIYSSTDAGVTWTQTSAPDTNYWTAIASSADGSRLAAGEDGGGIWISTDGGSSWTLSSAPSANWASIACSADGTRLAAGTYDSGIIYTSTNSGATWTSANAPTGNPWYSMAASADGTRLAAVTVDELYSSTGQAMNLASGTICHYRAVGVNSIGTGYGIDRTVTNIAGPPTATSLPASGITPTNAILNGSVTQNGSATSAYFRYGLTTNYGSFSATNHLPGTNLTLSVSNSISGLTLATTYHFQLVATNTIGTSLANDLTFTTSPEVPIVTTLAATSITPSNATLNGTVNPKGAATAAYFQYGLTTNYDNLGGLTALPATNSPQTLPGFVVNVLHGPAGTNWTQTTAPNAPNGGWYSIVSSSDGARLAAVVNGGGIYTSTDSGATWTLTSAPSDFWASIASSADGTKLAAALDNGGIYTSADGGDTWTQTSAPSPGWIAIASSVDGSRLAAVVNGGGAYTSTDSGVTWTQSSLPTDDWYYIVSSADGSRLVAVAQNAGAIYTSTDGGGNWVSNAVPSLFWDRIASSADGTQLAATVYGGGIYLSTNSGATWTLSSAPRTNWASIACSVDGTRLAAGVNGGGIYTSTNSGVTWTAANAPIGKNWNSMTASADGTRLAATAGGGGIYTSTGQANNLAIGMTCHYRAVGLNSAGTGYGNDLAFTIAVPPTATTLPASGITATNATLNGSINPNGAISTAYFRYGLTTNYGSYSATNTLAATNVTLSVSNLVGSLPPGTKYHFQLVASNSLGTSLGSDQAFTTGAAAPTATTLAATGVGSSSATLNGSVNPHGAITATYFQYGLTTNYGSYSVTNNLAATNSTLSISNQISSLTPGTTYHFKLVAGNSVSTNVGADLTFTTAPAVPTATTLAASSITASNATLNGSVNPNGAITTAYFRYGLTTNYGSFSATNSLSATNGALSVSNLIGNLAPGTTYHFQLVAANAAGTSAGTDMQFTTQSQAAQAVSFNLNGAVKMPSGAFQFSFTNLSGVSFTVLATTDLTLPLTNWTVLGAPVEGPPGQYQFTDSQATNKPIRFYRVRSP